MSVGTFWESVKHVFTKPIELGKTDRLKTFSPMRKADDMLSTAIFDLTEALKEKRDLFSEDK